MRRALTVFIIMFGSGLIANTAFAKDPRVVTRSEFARVELGMDKTRVENIFDAKSCEGYDIRLGGGDRLVGKQYKQANGRWTQIEYNTYNPNQRLRVDVKEFNNRRYQCA